MEFEQVVPMFHKYLVHFLNLFPVDEHFLLFIFTYKYKLPATVRETESGTVMLNWDSRYLCHFSTEMAEIWSPGTSFQDVWTCKISALYLLYFQSYESFCGVFSDFH